MRDDHELRVVLLDLAEITSTPAAEKALQRSCMEIRRFDDWQGAVQACARVRPDLAIIACRTIDTGLAEICTALRHANANGEVYPLLLAPEDALLSEALSDLGCVAASPLPDDWQAFARQAELAARSGRRVLRRELEWLGNQRAMQLLGAAVCSVDASSESCAPPTTLRHLLGIDGRANAARPLMHWRDLLKGLDEVGRARLESSIAMALDDGTPFKCRVGLSKRGDALLDCHGAAHRDRDGHIHHLILTWQELHTQGESSPTTVLPFVGREPMSTTMPVLERVHQQSSGSVLFFRIDNFPELCRTLGFVTGQRVLASLVERISDELRADDQVLPRGMQDDEQVTRIGGAEVVAVIDGLVEAESINRVRERILERLRRAFEVDGRRIPLKLSSGSASWPRDALNADELVVSAALAADYATETTITGGELGSAHLQKARDSIRLEADLYDAVLNRELKLHFQPKYALDNGALVGVEALLRWHRNGTEWVPPDVFIPIAERNGLISSIGRWVVEEAVRTQARWFEMGLGRVKMAINISPEQLMETHFIAELIDACEQHQVPAHTVELEVTESCLIEDSQRTIARLGTLRDAGFSIALDDFGTGFSSLSYLRSLPLDVLKIDRSFLSGLGTEGYDPGLLVCIIGLGLTLGLCIVAEGVEEPVQWRLLGEWGCHIGQGYLMSKPLAEGDLMPLLERAAWPGFRSLSA